MKILAIILVCLSTLFAGFITILDILSSKRGIPANVSDVFTESEYKKWISYNRDKNILDLVDIAVNAIVLIVLLATDAFSFAAGILETDNSYASTMIVLAVDLVVSFVLQTAFKAYDTFVIEEKYGFNRTKAGTFITDLVKDLVISVILEAGLISAFIAIHRALGALIIPIFSGIVLLFMFAMMFLSPFFMKIFNKSTPLEDGSLRDKLTKLLVENGCNVREIGVIDASKRSSKANAYFTGFGKTKSIGLYDTLIEQMTEDEIVAVFAHEMGHNKHKDTLKNGFVSIINIAIIMAVAAVLISFPPIYTDFGFTTLNYGFAFILLGSVCLRFISPLTDLLFMGFSRKAEYAADKFAADNGYAKELILALKKLGKANFANLNPHPVVVKLTYSHPTLSQRIEKLEKLEKEE